MTSITVGFLLMMSFCIGGQHPRLLRLLIQKRTSFQTIIVLDHFLSFSKNWDKEITEKVVSPKISSTIAKLKPFVKFNANKNVN